jgi:hypothetical protein
VAAGILATAVGAPVRVSMALRSNAAGLTQPIVEHGSETECKAAGDEVSKKARRRVDTLGHSWTQENLGCRPQ